MEKKGYIPLEGVVNKVHWKIYEVEIEWWLITNLNLKWKLKKNHIRIIEWDKVEVELNEIDPTKWYITKRL